jgi:hypothetical protein
MCRQHGHQPAWSPIVSYYSKHTHSYTIALRYGEGGRGGNVTAAMWSQPLLVSTVLPNIQPSALCPLQRQTVGLYSIKDGSYWTSCEVSVRFWCVIGDTTKILYALLVSSTSKDTTGFILFTSLLWGYASRCAYYQGLLVKSVLRNECSRCFYLYSLCDMFWPIWWPSSGESYKILTEVAISTTDQLCLVQLYV